MSEEPVYRISTLEGQVRLFQEKLTESHRQHDDILTKERTRAEETLANLRRELTSELQRARETIRQLRAKESSEDTSKQGAGEEETTPPPKGSVAVSLSDATLNSPTNGKRRPQKEELAGRGLSLQPIPRSASWADVHAGDGAGPGGLPDDGMVPGKSSYMVGGGEKLSITDMVTESLKNPGCIAAIRRELKADALTPKIQRKFQVKTTPTSLPSMNDSSSSLEGSPLAKENVKMATPRKSVLPNTNI